MIDDLFVTLCDLMSPPDLLELLLSKRSCSGVSPLPAELDRVIFPDFTVIRSLVPADILQRLNLAESLSQYLLTLALRHQATRLALMLHALARPQLSEFREMIEHDSHKFAAIKDLIRGLDARQVRPLLGFNATGLFLDYIPQKSCHHLDSYRQERCSELAVDLFCASHQNERWWSADPDLKLSPLAEMMSFYHDQENLRCYSSQELEALVQQFWQSLGRWQSQLSRTDLDTALAALAIKDLKHLNEIGISGLKKRYFQCSVDCHPDHGGDQRDFIKVKDSYQTLRSYLAGA